MTLADLEPKKYQTFLRAALVETIYKGSTAQKKPKRLRFRYGGVGQQITVLL